ncbi:hypothetical protein CDAR_312701 [Caerostris darwini]|uniref:Uncharacterized protein n=1 Tax=Caerostris darwini TaxID=1538125 RepID=A0AAV4MD95_9ARAC|nr:hypothetical protein CDAR_312701 [Caerostris darwini]
MSTSDSSSSEGEIGRNVVVPDNLTSEKASLRSKQLSQKETENGPEYKKNICGESEEGGCACHITVSNTAITDMRLAVGTNLQQIQY